MSRSSTWLSALAPPDAAAPPMSTAAEALSEGVPCAPAIIPLVAVSSRRLMMRGLVSST
jgi:hypothetical protein